jgi:hypothetical protein
MDGDTISSQANGQPASKCCEIHGDNCDTQEEVIENDEDLGEDEEEDEEEDE